MILMRVSSLPRGVAWFSYRRLRLTWYSLQAKNPLAGSSHSLSWSHEWASVDGLLRASRFRPILLETDKDGFMRWRTAAGEFWVPPGSSTHYVGMIAAEIASRVYCPGGYEKKLEKAFVIDCGANVGVFSRFALNCGASRVLSFEPSPVTAECLRRNLAPEIADGRAVVVEKGLWDRETVLGFSAGNTDNPGSHHVVELSGNQDAQADFTIPVTTIDSAVAAQGWPRIDYIKMDIEGAELRALRGGAASIGKHLPLCAIATEHTEDVLGNNVAVVGLMRSLHPSYWHMCTELHPLAGPASANRVLTPYTLLFQAAA